MTTIQAALLVEVQWGVVPGTVEDSKKWGFSREQVEAAFEEEQMPGDIGAWRKLLHDAYDEFDRRLNPRQNNWVTLTWLWL